MGVGNNLGFAWFRCRHSLNQSDANLTSITTWSPAFSALWAFCLFLHWVFIGLYEFDLRLSPVRLISAAQFTIGSHIRKKLLKHLQLVAVSFWMQMIETFCFFTGKKTSNAKTSPSKKDLALAAAHTRTHGTAALSVKMCTFFSGAKSTTTKLGKSMGTIEELLLSVSLDNDLLSGIQKRVLNPMVIRVSSASELPCKPMTYMQLREKWVWFRI